MLDLAQVIPAAMRDLKNPTVAEGVARVRSNALKDCLPLALTHQPTPHERMARAIHEGYHGVAGDVFGSPSIELVLREDATGYCRIAPLANAEHQIIFSLVGIIGEARYHPQSIHGNTEGNSYDLLSARLQIDAWQAAKTWPPMTYTRAVRLAMQFVDENWQAAKNVAAALNDCGSMDTYAVRLFARCSR
jgi:hypothetical protein